MSISDPSSSNVSLPCRLTFANSIDPAQSLVLTVIKPIFSISVSQLPPQLFTSRKSLWLSPASREHIGTAHDVFLAKIQDLHSENLRHGLLIYSGILEGAYELLQGCMDPLVIEDLTSEENVSQIPTRLDSFSSVAELVKDWSVDEVAKDERFCSRTSFSMKPPVTPSLVQLSPVAAVKYTISPQNEKNPSDFILSRYFNTLYSLTTPLSYFPKTALARFRNMCGNDFEQMKECLSNVYLTPEQLNVRRLAKYGLASNGTEPSSLHLTRFEAENQALLVSKHYLEMAKPELLESLLLELKIREAQLQILLLLELLICMNIDEKGFLEVTAKGKEKARVKKRKPALIRKKKNKVIPTFLGIGVPESEEESPNNSSQAMAENDHLSQTGLFASLNTLIDQIGLWDSLLGRSKIDKDQNTHGFLAFVIVPYFSKSLPAVVQYIIKIFKSLRPHISRPKLSKAERKISKTLFPTSASESNTPEQSMDSQSSPQISEFTKSLSALEPAANNERKSKFAKTLLSAENLPFLNRGSTTMDLNDKQPAFSLKRSKSNLGTKNLKRRQVDMSITRNDTSELDLKRQTSFLFADARKTKSGPSFSQQSSVSASVVKQVEATPAKPKRNTKIHTNTNTNTNPSFSTMDAPQVFATPHNQRTVDMSFVIKETPLVSQSLDKKTSIHDRLSQVARDTASNTLSIISSPVRDSEETQLFSNGRADLFNESSPVKVTSSPVQFKSKPGQKIPMKQSPFYNNSVTESPPLSRPVGGEVSPLSKRMQASSKPVKRKAPAKKAPKQPAAKNNKATKPNSLLQSLSNTDIFEIGDSTSRETTYAQKAQEKSKPGPSSTQESSRPMETRNPGVEKTKIPDSKPDRAADSDSDSDSDSDYERLLASAHRPSTKKYNKKRMI